MTKRDLLKTFSAEELFYDANQFALYDECDRLLLGLDMNDTIDVKALDRKRFNETKLTKKAIERIRFFSEKKDLQA